MNKNTQKEINCKGCNKQFTRTSNTNKYCPSCVRKRTENSRISIKKRTLICEVCKKSYTARHQKQKVCDSNDCKKVYFLVNFNKYVKENKANLNTLLFNYIETLTKKEKCSKNDLNLSETSLNFEEKEKVLEKYDKCLKKLEKYEQK